MSTNDSQLAKETVSLLQHIELNKAGWWDKAVHRLVMAVVWLAAEPPSASSIQTELEATFRLSLSTPKLMSALVSLESRKMLLRLPSDTYRIPDEQRVIFDKDIAAAEQVEGKARETFYKLVAEMNEGFDADKVWTTFEHEFLGPLIKQVGVNAYRLVAGEKLTIDQTLVDHFLKQFPPELHTKLRNLVTTFIDPKKPEVCAHISRMLHARFCVEASGLPENVLKRLNESVGKQIRFIMFVDTNFLFSLLELHENPSNASAQELRELIVKLNGNPHIELVITPETIEEAKHSIVYTKGLLDGLPAGQNFSHAALQANFSGMAVKFITERIRRNGKLTTGDWFDPYLDSFLPIARGKGVEIIDEKLDEYSTRQDVIDDINLVFKYEKKLPESKRKSYPKILHDMVLWHFVKDKRPGYIESPIDAKHWILTVDFRLIGFDEHKRKFAKSKVPLCIHPTSLIQLLQFWIPRSKEFEEAMLGSLRLPFLFQDFDAEGEKTSLKILKGIGRFEGSEGLSQSTIEHVMLNDALRSRLKAGQADEAEIELIRDALVEEIKLLAEAESRKAKELQEEMLKRESELATLAAQKQAADLEIAQTKKEKEEADTAASQALSSQAAELASVKAQLLEIEEAAQAARENRKAFLTYLSWLTFVIFISAISGWQATRFFPWYAKVLGSPATIGLAATITFILGHLFLEHTLCRRPSIAALWPVRQVKKFSKILWVIVVIGFFGGVGGNVYANWIQKNIDAEQPNPPAKERKIAEPEPQQSEKK